MNGKTENPVITYKKTSNIIDDARTIINSARSSAVRSVDFCRVQMYWNLGKRIFEEEQQGKERADYGTYLVKTLAKNLEKEYGSGFGERIRKWIWRKTIRTRKTVLSPVSNFVCTADGIELTYGADK